MVETTDKPVGGRRGSKPRTLHFPTSAFFFSRSCRWHHQIRFFPNSTAQCAGPLPLSCHTPCSGGHSGTPWTSTAILLWYCSPHNALHRLVVPATRTVTSNGFECPAVRERALTAGCACLTNHQRKEEEEEEKRQMQGTAWAANQKRPDNAPSRDSFQCGGYLFSSCSACHLSCPHLLVGICSIRPSKAVGKKEMGRAVRQRLQNADPGFRDIFSFSKMKKNRPAKRPVPFIFTCAIVPPQARRVGA